MFPFTSTLPDISGQMVSGEVLPVAEVDQAYPALKIQEDPRVDECRFRLLFQSVTRDGVARHVRLISWSMKEIGMQRLRHMDKEQSAKLAAGWEMGLMSVIQSGDIEYAKKMMGS